MSRTVALSIRSLFHKDLEDLQLVLLAGKEGLDRIIELPRPYKPSLALAGFYSCLKPYSLNVFGVSDMTYFKSLPPKIQKERLHKIFQVPIGGIIISEGQVVPELFIKTANLRGVPLMVSALPSGDLIERLFYFLMDAMAPSQLLSGNLMDVYGLGVLIRGPSGIGKSETCLELVKRGHRLICDDTMRVKKLPNNVLIGFPAKDFVYGHMEIRGIGIVNVKNLFGVTALTPQKELSLIIELEHGDPKKTYDRMGLDELREDILGVSLPKRVIPVFAGRNLALLVEVAARCLLLKNMGLDDAQMLNEQLNKMLEKARKA